ncbi:hypothetical protein GCM10010872_29580 [Dyella flava]|nr:hypothetical protein GCM10010872_29580 [Dyella flava]
MHSLLQANQGRAPARDPYGARPAGIMENGNFVRSKLHPFDTKCAHAVVLEGENPHVSLIHP